MLEHGPFRLGYSAYVHSALLPILLRLKLQETEASAMALESAFSVGMLQRVMRRELHARVGPLPVHDRDLWSTPIGQESFHICLAANHRLARKAAVAIRDQPREKVPWIPRSVRRKLYDATTK